MSKCLEVLMEDEACQENVYAMWPCAGWLACEMGLTLESEEGALGQLAGCEMGLTLESEEGEVPHLRWSQAPPPALAKAGVGGYNII